MEISSQLLDTWKEDFRWGLGWLLRSSSLHRVLGWR
ncbi:MAG: hypothetical protein ACI8XO_002329, partial [Verrucomicrobiales bacterium]